MTNQEDTSQKSRNSVTRRYTASVTKRFDAEKSADTAITRRFPTAAAKSPKTGTEPLIAERYRILDGPLGVITGEAEVFRCLDEQRQCTVVLKLYHYDATPKAEVIAQLQGLAHPNIVRLLDHGRWNGRFFEIMEYCAGGVLADIMPIAAERLAQWLPGILSGLDFCHRQGIVHRDLKPNNLFFRDAERSQPLIGDFGISSYLDVDAVRVTQSAAHLTLDYAAPELLDGHQVGIKTDYYALGITLIHLLTGTSPFAGLSHNDVLVAHLRGRLNIPESLPPAWRPLLRGLTLGQPEQRWGFAEVTAWLQGNAPPIDERHAAWSSTAHERHPYPGWPQAQNPQQLAQALDQFNAAEQLFRGDIRRWIFDHFDHHLADRIAQLEQQFADRPESGIQHLRFLLDPNAALAITDQEITTLGQLLTVLRSGNNSTAQAIHQLLANRVLEAWIEAGQLAGERTPELLERLAELRRRLGKELSQELALTALNYTLDPDQPLPITAKHAAANPGDIGLLFQSHRESIIEPLQTLLFSRKLEEWIRAARFAQYKTHLDFIRQLRRYYLDQQQLGVWCLCWRFNPDMPFPFGGVNDPKQLARLIDKSPKHTRKGRELLVQGWIRAWLVGTGKLDDPVALDHALLSIDASIETKLEAVLRMLDPSLSQPRLSVRPKSLNIGLIPVDSVHHYPLQIRNRGRGHLNGEIKLAQYGEGLLPSPHTVNGNHVKIDVTINPLGLSPGIYHNTLYIQTNGGEKEIPVSFVVREPEDIRSWWEKLLAKLYS